MQREATPLARIGVDSDGEGYEDPDPGMPSDPGTVPRPNPEGVPTVFLTTETASFHCTLHPSMTGQMTPPIPIVDGVPPDVSQAPMPDPSSYPSPDPSGDGYDDGYEDDYY